MISDQQPQDSDLILGGQQPPPVNAAVLGGLVGLNRRFATDNLEQKLATLVEAARHQDGLSLLYRGLEDQNLLVRVEAYLQLKALAPNLSEPPLILERGIPLTVGDRIYGVYRSHLSYGDDWYYIEDYITDYEDPRLGFYQRCKDTKAKKFQYIYDGEQGNRYHPDLVIYFIESSTAHTKAKEVYLGAFDLVCPYISEICRNVPTEPFYLKSWVKANQITVIKYFPDMEEDNDWLYECSVLLTLYHQKRYALLREIWEPLGYEPLSFVHEHIIDRPCYLRMGSISSYSIW
jgi:hypothetical protein